MYPLLLASFFVAALRFALIAKLATVWWILAFAQILHAVTFAVHHSASVLMIQRWFPGRAAARGQAVYISAAYGVGGTAGSLTAAYLWTLAGPGVGLRLRQCRRAARRLGGSPSAPARRDAGRSACGLP